MRQNWVSNNSSEMEISDNSGETVRHYCDFTKALTGNYVSWAFCFAIATGAEEQNHESRTELEAIAKNRKQVPTTAHPPTRPWPSSGRQTHILCGLVGLGRNNIIWQNDDGEENIFRMYLVSESDNRYTQYRNYHVHVVGGLQQQKPVQENDIRHHGPHLVRCKNAHDKDENKEKEKDA